jgi:hypothetical protein
VLGNWQALTRYTEDGRLKIDNNGAERAIKPVVRVSGHHEREDRTIVNAKIGAS